MITETERKVLLFLAIHGETTARVVAMHLWPDSPGWRLTSKRSGSGGGGAYGVGLPMRAGSILSRMWSRKLVSHRNTLWGIIEAGRQALTAAEAAHRAVSTEIEVGIRAEAPQGAPDGS